MFSSVACITTRERRSGVIWTEVAMIKFLLFCILLVLCWPLALIALIAYPIVWLLLLPFRLLGIAVHGVLDLVAAVIMLPARLIRAI